jgi:hypothetical protein
VAQTHKTKTKTKNIKQQPQNKKWRSGRERQQDLFLIVLSVYQSSK